MRFAGSFRRVCGEGMNLEIIIIIISFGLDQSSRAIYRCAPWLRLLRRESFEYLDAELLGF